MMGMPTTTKVATMVGSHGRLFKRPKEMPVFVVCAIERKLVSRMSFERERDRYLVT